MKENNQHQFSVRKDMEKSLHHFHKAMQKYIQASSEPQKQVAKNQMEATLELMDTCQSNWNKEQRVLQKRLSKHFYTFLRFPTEHNCGVIQQDLEALEESFKP